MNGPSSQTPHYSHSSEPARRSTTVDAAFASFLLAALLVLAGCANPPINSLVTAHGNTDWHINTAHKFATGTGYNDGETVANSAPASWTTRHAHIGASNTAHYYYDPSVTSPGDDADATDGIDQLMLFFYAGHGNPTIWNTLGDNGTQANVRLGNSDQSGYLRYYWQCSCDVFAHGPRDGTCGKAGTFEYACPRQFDGSADSSDMRNVYERWGASLGPQLRMACGASTAAYCHGAQVDKIWDDYNNKGYDVADAFIDGLDTGGVVPLCIARGGENAWDTPLYDTTFTNAANDTGGTKLYLQYLETFKPIPFPIPIEIPPKLPVWKVIPDPPPPDFRQLTFRRVDGVLIAEGDALQALRTTALRAANANVRQARMRSESGALYLKGETRARSAGAGMDEQRYVDAARAVAVLVAGDVSSMSPPQARRMVIASQGPVRVAAGVQGQETPQQKNVIVTFRRTIAVEGVRTPVPVFGRGGLVEVQLANDGALQNASKVWRRLDGVARETETKSLAQAQQEAMQQFPRSDAYKLARWQWGYKEDAGNAVQRELMAYYFLEFEPRNLNERTQLPPVMIEVLAHR